MTATLPSVAELEQLLALAKKAQVEADAETPHSRLLAELGDHRVHPVELGDALARIFAGFELLGVDLLAEGGPARKSRKTTKPDDQAPADPSSVSPEGAK